MSVFERIQQNIESQSPSFALPLPSSIQEIQALNPAKLGDAAGANLPNSLSKLGFPALDIIKERSGSQPSSEMLLAGAVDLRIRPAAERAGQNDLRSAIASSGDSRVRPSQIVEVKQADTLSGIAKDVLSKSGRQPSQTEIKSLVDEICRRNGITNPDRIYPGDRLFIPGAKEGLSAKGKEGAGEDKERSNKKLEDVKPRAMSSQEKEADALTRHFDKIDRDKSDRISKEELNDYTESLRKQLRTERDPEKARQLKEDIMSLDRAGKNFDSIKDKSNDDWGRETGISRRDVAKHSEDPVRQAKEEREVMRRNFDNMDKDGNDRISKEELQDYIENLKLQQLQEKDPAKREQMRKDLAVLSRIADTKFDAIEQASQDDWFWEKGISRRDLNNHVLYAEFPDLEMATSMLQKQKEPADKGARKEMDGGSKYRRENLDQYIQLV